MKMPKLLYRKIYDDDGEELREGSKVMVNGKFERILHFNSDGEITLEDFDFRDVETIEQIPDDRFGELKDSVIE